MPTKFREEPFSIARGLAVLEVRVAESEAKPAVLAAPVVLAAPAVLAAMVVEEAVEVTVDLTTSLPWAAQ